MRLAEHIAGALYADVASGPPPTMAAEDEERGVIIHTASVVGLVGVRNRAAYSLSKGALITLTKNMALDYAPEGIRVNAVCPGFVDTGMTKGLFADAERAEEIRKMHPLGRFATADDIAATVTFLASDDAAFITGQALAVEVDSRPAGRKIFNERADHSCGRPARG